MHAVALLTSWYEPVLQRAHVSSPGSAAYEPGRQILHAVRSVLPVTGLALPAGQPSQVALFVAPSALLHEPAGHASNVMLALAAPTCAQKPPEGHSSHREAPGRVLKVPGGHCVHSAAPDDEL